MEKGIHSHHPQEKRHLYRDATMAGYTKNDKNAK
jgi:hypothetical protein